MAKRSIFSPDTTTNDPKLVLIVSLIAQLSAAIVDYLGDFNKNTSGKKSVGDYSLEFINECFIGITNFPEIIAQSYNKEDLTAKLVALNNYVAFQVAINEAIDQKWATNLMICKTDALNYAYEFYAIVQREAAKSTTYQPLLDKLKTYHKKTKSDSGNKSDTAQKTKA